jgi:predicted secreted protein
MAKYAAKGVTLTVNSVAIPGLVDIGSTGGGAEEIDVTSHDSTGEYREFIRGFKGRAGFTFTIRWDPNLAAHKGLTTLYANGNSVAVSIGLPVTPAATITFNAFVADIPLPSTPIDGALNLEVTMTVTGAITFPA